MIFGTFQENATGDARGHQMVIEWLRRTLHTRILLGYSIRGEALWISRCPAAATEAFLNPTSMGVHGNT